MIRRGKQRIHTRISPLDQPPDECGTLSESIQHPDLGHSTFYTKFSCLPPGNTEHHHCELEGNHCDQPEIQNGFLPTVDRRTVTAVAEKCMFAYCQSRRVVLDAANDAGCVTHQA